MYQTDEIKERVIAIANYVIETGDTVRKVAKKFNISKSTVHKDLSERLEKYNKNLAIEARKRLDVNKSQRHIRGGLATKLKYENKKV